MIAPLSSLAQDAATFTPTATLVQTLVRPTVLSTGLPPIGQSTATRTRVATSTRTPSPTATRTRTPTRTSTNTPTNTQTAIPSNTASLTPTASYTFTPFPSSTAVVATNTATNTPTLIVVTHGVAPSVVSSSTPTPTQTSTVTDTVTYTPSATSSVTPITPTPSITPSSSLPPTATLTVTVTPTSTITTTRVPAVVESSRPANSHNESGGGTSPLIFLAGIVLTGLIGGYIVMFATSQAAAERYASGFVIQTCPVCYEGHLHLEERSNRVLGILRIRRTVRCDNCRSVLREVSKHRWRYAVDRAVSPEMYASLNNRLLREEQLIDLVPSDEYQSPEYFEDAPDEY